MVAVYPNHVARRLTTMMPTPSPSSSDEPAAAAATAVTTPDDNRVDGLTDGGAGPDGRKKMILRVVISSVCTM